MKYVSLIALFSSLSAGLSLPLFKKRQANSAIASSIFRRRAYQSTAVLDGWLYIDGGEFSYASGSDIVYQYSSTLLSIDLSQDFTNATVNINSNSKPAGVPDLDSGGIWVDKVNKVLYTGFAGRSSTFGNAAYQDRGLWSFSPDGQGGGSWKNLNSTAPAGFKTEVRPYSALVASGDGKGFMLGGFDPANASVGISGLVIYDFSSNKLSNNTVTGIANKGVVQMGGAHFVPNFGPQGIMITFAGDQVGAKQAGADSLLSTTTVQIYDPATGVWYEQTTSGNIPEPRKEFCMTGAASNNETYEIFVYAGWNGNLGPVAIPYDEVYVLSLPSFNWFKADYLAENPRHGLTCNHIGGGQILTVGGVNTTQNGPNNLYDDVFNTPDQFTQGLNVFDLSTMAWATSYSAQKQTYSPAAAIQQYYSTNPRHPTYSSTGLQQLMSVQNFTSATTGSSSSSSNSTSPASPGSSSSGSSTNTGAIAGGVVGGVVAVALIAGGAVFFLRRRRNKEVAGGGDAGSFATHEMPGNSNSQYEMSAAAENTPMANNIRYAKYAPVPSEPRHEMPTNETRHELA
ncbi:uncharacterized protein PV09_00534 [Verruconis gallopava]|uniref:Kelch repeat protein n=1 Tax=Verruconis gallopava TaxID=253628 RepID=A0A0D2BBB1_9PEZI|nr:uncharacterized protein PV09_00534 [Verruconis gallopava]KIW08569.1 hypothetical protein PV09_00534 [Verruconis gallopava]